MKKIIKTTISVILATGMLTMGVPVLAYAEEIDPNELLTEDELPEDAVIIPGEEEDEGEIRVYEYDENGNLVPINPVFEDPEDPAIKDEEPESEGSEENVEEHVGPLTPDGNLNLVDDYGSDTKAGKQFITVQTKSGKYFYIIIDRDDNGTETVHFLNQVDEADILAYMEDEAVQAYEDRKTALEEKKEALKAEEETLKQGGDPTPSPSESPAPSGTAEKKPDLMQLSPKSMMIVASIIALGIGAVFYMKVVKKKKPAASNNPAYDDDDEWDDETVDSELANVPDENTEDPDNE